MDNSTSIEILNCVDHSIVLNFVKTLICTVPYHASGKSKTNVKELFDSSVPLDIEDLKAEFDNAPVPSLDNDDILRGILWFCSFELIILLLYGF